MTWENWSGNQSGYIPGGYPWGTQEHEQQNVNSDSQFYPATMANAQIWGQHAAAQSYPVGGAPWQAYYPGAESYGAGYPTNNMAPPLNRQYASDTISPSGVDANADSQMGGCSRGAEDTADSQMGRCSGEPGDDVETAKKVESGDEELDHATAVYCKECQTWLNGPRQWEDHKIGKKHRKNVQKAKRGNPSGSGDAANDVLQGVDSTPDVVPLKKTEAWQWLEDGKALKEKEEEEKLKDGNEGKTSRSARRRRHKKEKEEREAAEAAANTAAAALAGLDVPPEHSETANPNMSINNVKTDNVEEDSKVGSWQLETVATVADSAEIDDSTIANKAKVVPPREEFLNVQQVH